MKRRLLLAVACGALASAATGRSEAASSQPSVLVQLAKLKPGSLPQIVIAYGKVEPSAAARRTITAPLAAEIGRVYVRIGELVDEGAALLRLAPSPETAAAYTQAQSALRVASQLRASTGKLVEGHLATRQQLADAAKSEADARAALAALEAQGADGPHVLRAPFRAIVTGLSTSEGSLCVAGAGLIDLARPEGLVLRVGAVPAEAARIAPGDKAAITSAGRARDGFRHGPVARVDRRAGERPRPDRDYAAARPMAGRRDGRSRDHHRPVDRLRRAAHRRSWSTTPAPAMSFRR